MKPLDEFATFSIPVTDIFVDAELNCRSEFTLESVRELAESIKVHGLQMPVIVQPWSGPPYRLVAGHRRYKAVTKILKWSAIPACVRDIDGKTARKINLLENLEREDLNIVEEAHAIEKLYPGGAIMPVARELNKSYRWVQWRRILLRFPEEVQNMFASGLLPARSIQDLARVKGGSRGIVRAAHGLLKGRGVSKSTRAMGVKLSQPVRNRAQISDLVARMLTAGVTGLGPRVASWCAGHITDEEIEEDIQKELELRGIHESQFRGQEGRTRGGDRSAKDQGRAEDSD